MSLKSGTNSFHGVVYDFMRRKALAANSFLLNSRSAPKTDQYIDQYGFSVDGPIWKNKTFFLFTGEKYREGTPAPLFSTVPTPAFKNGDFSNLVDASGQPDPDLRSGDRPRRERRLDARSVPGQHHPGGAASIRRPGRSCSTSRTRTTPTRRLRRGSGTWPGPSTSTRTCSGTGSGRSTTTSAPNDRAFFRWAENERNEIGNRGQRHPQRSRPGRPAAAHQRANRAVVGDWVHIFGAGTVFNLRGGYTYFLEWSQSADAFNFDATEFWPASLVDQLPSQGARRPVPAHRGRRLRAAVARHQSRTGTGTGRSSRTCR